MLPILVLVGRPNVGKSTLFNRLTRSRNALVADFPGLTRDRQYGRGSAGGRRFIVVDTGGFEPVAKSGILHEMAKQARAAIAEADAVVFMVDARSGLTEQDRTIARLLRRSGRPVLLAVNKAEGIAPERAAAEFHELGLGEPYPISAAHGENVDALAELALAALPADADDDADVVPWNATTKIAIVGRPNVGKSTLVNTLLGEERVIAFDEPGTTRDALYLDFERAGRRYTLIDTAGVRRRGKVWESVEKFSVVKTLQAIDDANVVVLLLDAATGIAEQDAHLAGHIVEAGRALVVGVNKWDRVPAGGRDDVKRDLDRKMGFLDYAQKHFISARDGSWHCTPATRGRCRLCRGHVEAADAEAHAGARGRSPESRAAPRRRRPAEAALCAPRRAEPAGRRHPRDSAPPHPCHVPALSGTFLPRGVPTARYPP